MKLLDPLYYLEGRYEKPFLGAIIGAAGGLLGAKMQSNSAREAARDSNMFTKEQLQNRHQWEVNDLRKAGLNPILSAGGAPSIGGSAQAQTPDFSGSITKGISSALEYKRTMAEIDQIKANTEVSHEASVTQKTQQAANLATAALATNNARVAKLEGDKQQVLKAGYTAVAPTVEKLASGVSNSAKSLSSSASILWDYINPKNLYTVPKNYMKGHKK